MTAPIRGPERSFDERPTDISELQFARLAEQMRDSPAIYAALHMWRAGYSIADALSEALLVLAVEHKRLQALAVAAQESRSFSAVTIAAHAEPCRRCGTVPP